MKKFFFLFLLLNLSVHANHAFYAISSLRYHLDNIIENKESEDQVLFTSDDIDNLWNTAAKSANKDGINLAKKCYYQANLHKSQDILEHIWTELNEQFFEEKKNKWDFYCDVVADYLKHDDVSNDFLKETSVFLLPRHHPMHRVLGEIFYSHHFILRNMENFTYAGFIPLFHQPLSHIVVAKHPMLNGYLVKAYLDSDSRTKNNDPPWKWLVRRCKGAQNIRKLISRKNLQHFSVPDKWLYMTDPNHPSPSRQNIILLVTDMCLVSREETEAAWKNLATKKHLEELYCIFSHGYSSSWLVENIPYTREGKFSCIDTEYPKRKLHYENAKPYFNEEMQQYWDLLIRTGGKP